jgi:hypothetical protein
MHSAEAKIMGSDHSEEFSDFLARIALHETNIATTRVYANADEPLKKPTRTILAWDHHTLPRDEVVDVKEVFVPGVDEQRKGVRALFEGLATGTARRRNYLVAVVLALLGSSPRTRRFE